MVDLSDFYLALAEDETVNRMAEQLVLWGEVSKSKYFSKSHVVLILNKCDAFRERIKTHRLKDYFNTYSGDNSYESALSFLRDQYLATEKRSRIGGSGPAPYIACVETCAFEESDVRAVLDLTSKLARATTGGSSAAAASYSTDPRTAISDLGQL